jgi:hypothetical protein
MKSILFFLLLLGYSASAQDYNNTSKVYVEAGITGGTYSNTGYNVGVFGGLGFFFNTFGKQSAIDIRAKELYISNPERESGAITISYRFYVSKGFYLGAGFAHNHEVNMDDFLKEPVRSIMGNGDAIIHRTGVVGEFGYDFKSIFKNFGLYPTTNVSVAYLTLDNEPNPLINLSIGVRIGVKKQ